MMLLLALDVRKLTYDLLALQPSLRDLAHSKLAPALKRRAIFTMSLRDRALAEKAVRLPNTTATLREPWGFHEPSL